LISFFTEEDLFHIPEFMTTPVTLLDTIILTPELHFNKLKELNQFKYSGPEGWPIAMLREVADQIFTSLYA